MPSRLLPLTLLLTPVFLLLHGCSSNEYKVLGKNTNSPACAIHSAICVETHIFQPAHYEKDEMLITYGSGQPGEVADEVLRKYRLRAKRRDSLESIGTKMVTAATNGQDPYDLVQAIKQQEKAVDASTNNFYVTTAISRAGSRRDYPLGLTGAQLARELTNGGEGVVIGMIDTPVDMQHNDTLGAAIERHDLIPPGNILNRLHGTEVAGILVSNNRRIGIAPKAKVIAISAFSSDPDNPERHRSNSGLIARALEYAIRQDVDILNLSFAGGSDPIVDKLIKAALERGIIVVAAAGNGGPKAEPAYPAALGLPGLLAVTAVDKQETVFRKANRGNYIDVAAPGVNILTTAPGNTFHVSSGTSLATAHVSGILALLLSHNPDFDVELLTRTAIDLGQQGRDDAYGHGLVNVQAVLQNLGIQ